MREDSDVYEFASASNGYEVGVQVVAHELRNSLGVIRNSIYYLSMRLADADEKVKKHLRIIEREIANSNKIINDLLGLAQARKPTLKEADINAMVEEVLSRSPVPENVAVVTELGEGLAPLMADRTR